MHPGSAGERPDTAHRNPYLCRIAPAVYNPFLDHPNVQKMLAGMGSVTMLCKPSEQWLKQRYNAGARRQQRCAADRMVRGGAAVCSHGEVNGFYDDVRGDRQRPPEHYRWAGDSSPAQRPRPDRRLVSYFRRGSRSL